MDSPEAADCYPSLSLYHPTISRWPIGSHRHTGGSGMASTLAQNVFQIGFVVPDIHKGMAFFKDKLGVPEFLFIEKPNFRTRPI
jgi:hypothetical protein